MLFKIVIVGDAAEPCSADLQVGEALKGACGRPDCPGCLARRLAAEVRDSGLMNHREARCLITYDPGANSAVVEDLANGVLERRGTIERDPSELVEASAEFLASGRSEAVEP